MTAHAACLAALQVIKDIAEGSTTPNSLPHIAKIAAAALQGKVHGYDADGYKLKPIDMVLHCPACGTQHIDAPDGVWTNPPHRSHLCHHCSHIWRPADVATNGVASIQTRGKDDVNTLFFDLEKIAWGAIRKAASESKWLPPEYFMNDWVNDVERFLRDGPASFP